MESIYYVVGFLLFITVISLYIAINTVYVLEIKRNGKWEKIGPFDTHGDALDAFDMYYSNATDWKIINVSRNKYKKNN